MKTVSKTLMVDPDLFDQLDRILKMGKQVPDWKDDAVLHTFTVDFGGGIEADIKVCNGDSPWVDSVLFEDGSEIQVLEPSDILEGEYPFDYDGTNYVVTLERGASASPNA